MAWEAETVATQNSVGNTWTDIGSEVALNPGEVAHEQIEADVPSTPTDSGEYRILASTADAAGGSNWDTQPLVSGQLDNADDPGRVSVTVAGVRRYKVQVQSSGSTDTIDFTRRYSTDGVNL